MKKLLLALAGLGGLSLAGTVWATTCPQALASYALVTCDAACKDQIRSYHPECFGAGSSTASGTQNIQATTLQQMVAVSNAVSARLVAYLSPRDRLGQGLRTGLAAGNQASKWNVWANLSNNNQKYDRGVYTDTTGTARTNRFDNDVQNVVLGGDYQYSPVLVLGVSGSFDRGSGSAASYTIAAPTGSKSLSTSGYSVAPYLGWQINKQLALDASIGWGSGDSTTDGSIKSDSDRKFYGVNLNYANWYGNWQVTGKLGYLHGSEKYGDSTNNGATLANSAVKNTVGQWRLGAQAGYWMDGMMPYIGLAYASDHRGSSATEEQRANTRIGAHAWVWSVGLNFFSLRNSLTGGLAYERENGRDFSRANDQLTLNISYRF